MTVSIWWLPVAAWLGAAVGLLAFAVFSVSKEVDRKDPLPQPSGALRPDVDDPLGSNTAW